MNFQKIFGNAGESLAEKFLQEKGLIILARNFHTREGEVDLVCQEGDLIVFVEVKARRSQKFGSAIEAVDERKLQKVVAAGETWLVKNFRHHAEWRMDVVAIQNGKIEWIKGV